MKYLVNRQTKEHQIATPLAESIIERYPDFRDDWQLVEADSEGWIPWSGGECPLPYACKVAIIIDERIYDQDRAGDWDWRDDPLTAYRPILETAEKEEKQLYTEPTKVELLFDRLKSAVAASESIPTLLAEIDAMLPPQYRIALREVNLVEQPAEDMTDWRNWKEGDLIECVNDEGWETFHVGGIYKFTRWRRGGGFDADGTEVADDFVADFRFHSRPTKERV